MKIQIIAISTSNATSSKGTAYEVVEATFKNLTFNKTETKKLTPFGANKDAFTALKQAKQGDTFEVTVQKNNAGFNDWIAVVPASAGAATPAAYEKAAPAASKGGWETPEERAKKQVYIVRQSSISAAVSALSVGAKATPKPEDVVSYAKVLEAYVFDISKPAANDSGFDDMASDDFEDVPL